ncbi:MAG TPA: DUF748 domain-containing protein [Cyclobacteriaceae bacterium]|nr:DUF748 domain-containing protein [Cyclobacteriaceae bacterium]
MKKERKIPKKWYWIGGILIVLIAARLAMPYFVTRYVNKVLSELEGYRGSIYDVDIHLYRGAYTIDSLKVFKIDGNKEVPFVDIPVTDLSVEWSALFDGEVVGEVIFNDPKLNFIGGNPAPEGGDEGTANQSGGDVDWTKPLKDLMPLKINRMEIQDGTVSFHNFTTKPQVTVSLTDLDALATNLRNTTDQEERLPSTISATATSIGGGRLFLNMAINILKPIPDMDLDMKFEQVNMPALNDFFRAYASVDVERGSFNLYSEVTIDSGMVAGYVKPIAVDVKVVDWQKDKEKPLNLLWQSFVGLVAEVFENQKEDQFATRVPLDGDLNKIEAGVWPSVWNIFRNAFVKAFDRNTDNSVQFAEGTGGNELQNAGSDNEKTRAEARADRKAERKQKKELRREKRKKQQTKPS